MKNCFHIHCKAIFDELNTTTGQVLQSLQLHRKTVEKNPLSNWNNEVSGNIAQNGIRDICNLQPKYQHQLLLLNSNLASS